MIYAIRLIGKNEMLVAFAHIQEFGTEAHRLIHKGKDVDFRTIRLAEARKWVDAGKPHETVLQQSAYAIDLHERSNATAEEFLREQESNKNG